MLSNHMLMDLYGVFVAVRENPLILSADAYGKMAELLDTSTDHNSIRILFRECIHIQEEQKAPDFIYVENRYATSFLCKDETAKRILKWILLHFMQLAEESDSEQIIDFADAVHFMPLLAYQPPFKITQRQFEKLIREYARKWKVPKGLYHHLRS